MRDWAVTDVTVNQTGHAFQTCHVTTSTNRVQLKTKKFQKLFCLMRQNRHSIKVYVCCASYYILDSFRIRIEWIQPKEESDWIRISFFKHRIGSDSKKTLSDQLCTIREKFLKVNLSLAPDGVLTYEKSKFTWKCSIGKICQVISLTFIATEWFLQLKKLWRFWKNCRATRYNLLKNCKGQLSKIQPLKILSVPALSNSAARPKSGPLAACAISYADSCCCWNWKVTPGPSFHKILTLAPGQKKTQNPAGADCRSMATTCINTAISMGDL